MSSRQYVGKRVNTVHRGIEGELTFEKYDKRVAEGCDFVFVCTPHTKAMEYVAELSTRIIDLSADFRLREVKTYEAVYRKAHTAPELLREAVYGLPEIHRKEIKRARIVANPGCFATGAILALWPLVRKYDIKEVIIDAKTGVSGAGREPNEKTHFPWANENVIPYLPVGHRHIAEMEQELGIKVFFTPHMVPMSRGIETTVHALMNTEVEDVKKAYEEAYGDEPFVDVVDWVPTVLEARGSNYCKIGGFSQEEGRLVLFSVIDNLIKGASGQAVQNMNIMWGFKEDEGLQQLPLAP